MNFLKHFFSYDFLIYINRVRIEPVDKVFAILAAVLVVVAIVLRIAIQMQKNPVRKGLLFRLWRLAMTIGLLGIVWYGARYELVTWIGSHAAFLLLMVVGIIWLGYVVKYWRKQYRIDVANYEKKVLKDKYLQKPKR